MFSFFSLQTFNSHNFHENLTFMETGLKLNFNLNIYILIDFLRSNKDEGRAENLKWSLNKTIGAFVISEYILANGSQRLEIVVLFWI